MKRVFAVSAVAMVAAMAMLGCEWSTHSDDVQGYNDTAYQWVSFSGTYQRYLTAPLESSHIETYTTKTTQTVTDPETGETTVIEIPQENTREVADGADESKLSGNLVVTTATGKPVTTLAVSQKGQRLSIRDNAGGSFSGTISDLRSSMGKAGTTNLVVGDVVVASFSCSGKSGAGLATTLTGTFQGQVIDGPAFAKRTITGTWIEQGGRTASIYGAAEPIVGTSGGGSAE